MKHQRNLKKRPTHFDGLYGEQNTWAGSDYFFSELIATRSKDFGWQIQPHFHAVLYQLFFIISGDVKVFFSENGILVTGPCILLVPPLSTHGLHYNPDVKGNIFTISAKIIDRLFPKSSPVAELLKSPRAVINFNKEFPMEKFVQLINKIDDELFSDRPENTAMVQTLLTELLIHIYRTITHNKVSNSTENTYLLKFKQFNEKIKNSDYPKPITSFARELQITPVHLTRICRSITGNSPLQLIQRHLVGEAMRYLTYTPMSISEITYQLKFQYPNYFARMFKKYTGLSPTAFRKKNNGSVQAK